MPHMLIAGATGAGKSSCLNSLLTSILMRSTPDQVRMILVDPKRVEMGQYDRLPHLLTQVVTNPKKAANALAWAVKEMERRYDLLAEVGFRDITGYNAAVDQGDLAAETDAAGDVVREYPRLPFILVVIDELADLMMVAARDVEESICRHRPDGPGRGHPPGHRHAAAVGQRDHRPHQGQRPGPAGLRRVVGDRQPGHPRPGRAPSGSSARATCCCSTAARRWPAASRARGSPRTRSARSPSVWKRQAPDVAFDDSVQGSDDDERRAGSGGGPGGGGDDDDDLLFQAMELVVRSQLGSTSMLQRKLRVGFARAGRLMDLLEQTGRRRARPRAPRPARSS